MRFAACLCAAGLAVLVLALLLNTTAAGQQPAVPAVPDEPPTVLAVAPGQAPNNLDTTLTITGTGFEAVLSGSQVLTAPLVSLDDFDLPDVGWISSRTLTAIAPWGLDPGVYTATVTNPDGARGILPAAFAVEQAIGIWTSGGPYGGFVTDVAASHLISQTACANVSGIGLFCTHDGGDWWDLLLRDPSSRGVMVGVAPDYPIYYWGQTGLWRSDDDGRTFGQVRDDPVFAFAPDPDDPLRLWAVASPEVVLTTDGGQEWETRNDGLRPEGSPVWLAVDPVTPSTLYAVYADGPVFKTIDSGLSWASASSGLPTNAQKLPEYVLAIDPNTPNVLLYATPRGPETGYRSSDGGESWSLIQVAGEPGAHLSDLSFSAQVSGTVYASNSAAGESNLAVSTDGGATWMPMGQRSRDGLSRLALDPATGLPHYAGATSSGTWRSLDGGASWEMATEGVTGMQIQDVVASRQQPETVFMAGVGAGAFVSRNAGHSWQALDTQDPYAISMAVDPLNGDNVYINGGDGVSRSQDGGRTWEREIQPGSYAYFDAFEVSPADPSILYLGGREAFTDTVHNRAVLYRSSDYGLTWAPMTPTVPMSMVLDLAGHPTDAQVLYVAAGNKTPLTLLHPGKGIFCTTDGGDTWAPLKNGMGDVTVSDIEIDPSEPQIMYATAWLTAEEKVALFKTEDGGAHWYPTSLRLDNDFRMGKPTAVVDPLSPNIVYAGTSTGLFRSTNRGQTWTRAAGALGRTEIGTLSATSFADRTIVYAGTLGGEYAASLAGGLPATTPGASDYVHAGVYQYTDTHHAPAIYLPTILKSPLGGEQ